MKTLFTLMFLVTFSIASAQLTTGFFFNTSDGRTGLVNSSEYLFTGSTDGSHLEFDVEKTNSKWLTYFQSPQGEPLVIGTKYFITNWTVDYSKLNSWQDASGRQVGMSVLENWDQSYGQFPTQVSGTFTILGLEYDPVTGAISSFAVNFQQYNVGVAGRGPDWIYGSIRYNSSIALSDGGTGYLSLIPEPSTYAAIFGCAALGIALWCRRKSAQTNSVLSVG